MQRAAFWLFAIAAPVAGLTGAYHAAMIILGHVSASYTGFVLLELVIALLCGLVAMLLARSCRVTAAIDLQTELQAQLAAEMIRKKTLKRLDLSQDGGMAVNGNRLGS